MASSFFCARLADTATGRGDGVVCARLAGILPETSWAASSSSAARSRANRGLIAGAPRMPTSPAEFAQDFGAIGVEADGFGAVAVEGVLFRDLPGGGTFSEFSIKIGFCWKWQFESLCYRR